MEIFELKIDLENACEYVVDDTKIDYEQYFDQYFVGEPLPERWRLPQHFLGDSKKPLRDFVFGENQAPYVSERAVHALKPIAHPSVEFVPIGNIRENPYFVMNVVHLIDCLDREGSDIQFASDASDEICTIWNFAFQKKKVPRDIHVFKIPEDTGHIFVTDRLIQCIVEYEISGVTFQDPANLGISTINHAVAGLPLRQ